MCCLAGCHSPRGMFLLMLLPRSALKPASSDLHLSVSFFPANKLSELRKAGILNLIARVSALTLYIPLLLLRSLLCEAPSNLQFPRRDVATDARYVSSTEACTQPQIFELPSGFADDPAKSAGRTCGGNITSACAQHSWWSPLNHLTCDVSLVLLPGHSTGC